MNKMKLCFVVAILTSSMASATAEKQPEGFLHGDIYNIVSHIGLALAGHYSFDLIPVGSNNPKLILQAANAFYHLGAVIDAGLIQDVAIRIGIAGIAASAAATSTVHALMSLFAGRGATSMDTCLVAIGAYVPMSLAYDGLVWLSDEMGKHADKLRR